MSDKNRSKWKNFFCGFIFVLGFSVILHGLLKMPAENKIYFYDPDIIVSEHSDTNGAYFTRAVTEENCKKVSFLLLGGCEMIYEDFSISDMEQTIYITANKKCGDIKILMQNKKDGTIVSQELHTGKNLISATPGAYRLFAVGRYFWGEVSIESSWVSSCDY